MPMASAWRWQALDSAGAVVEAGVSPSRQLAAACVIRALARDDGRRQAWRTTSAGAA
jgi:hypothetical protein